MVNIMAGCVIYAYMAILFIIVVIIIIIMFSSNLYCRRFWNVSKQFYIPT